MRIGDLNLKCKVFTPSWQFIKMNFVQVGMWVSGNLIILAFLLSMLSVEPMGLGWVIYIMLGLAVFIAFTLGMFKMCETGYTP